MKIKLFALSILLYGGVLSAATPCKLVDGVVEFAKGKINGTLIYDQKQLDDALAISTNTAVIHIFTSMPYEASIATSGLHFESKTDFEQSVNDVQHLQDKRDALVGPDKRNVQPKVDTILTSK